MKFHGESSHLIILTIPFGQYRWKALLFRITPAAKIFLESVYNISDLEGVLNKTDDILVFGKGKTMEEVTADHYRKLKRLLQRYQECGICLNSYKLDL